MVQYLEDVISSCTSTEYWLALAAVIMITLAVLWWRSRSSSLQNFLIENPPQDTVILHQFGKALTVPSVSPFVMKLETYLRVAKIPYINKHSRKPGPKGKLPWIQYNDQVVPDSQLCIQFLNTCKNVNLNKWLSPDQVAIGHLTRRTAEESLYWVLLAWRLALEPSGDLYKKLGLPAIIVWYMRRQAKPSLWSHGIGRLTQAEVTQIMEDDLLAISQILGEKRFLFGDSLADVTEFDCALFGQLSQLAWQMPGCSTEAIIADKFPNLVRFCEAMKNAFWPDWEERLLHPPKISANEKTQEDAGPKIEQKTTKIPTVKKLANTTSSNSKVVVANKTIPSGESLTNIRNTTKSVKT